MDAEFVRTGPLMDLKSYPQWLQAIVEECGDARRAVTGHELFQMMKDGEVKPDAARRLLIGAWPVIEQFPQYMAMNLLKVRYGLAPGHEMGRRYLIRNMRVEQNHVQYWMEWAHAHGVSREDLLFGQRSPCAEMLSHWCWCTCERDSLPAAMAATNYAIEGTTGEWAAFVCSSTQYENGFAPAVRNKAMKWLRVHAKYDDAHPWEALEIIATLIGNRATTPQILSVQSGILKSYQYLRVMFDECLGHERGTQRTANLSGIPFRDRIASLSSTQLNFAG